MKRISAIFLCIILVLGGCKTGGGGDEGGADGNIPEAGTEDYTATGYAPLFQMWEQFEKPYTDADKTGADDSNMCWAAVAANLLAWGGWVADEDDVFNTFIAQFDNKPGYVYTALSYYFDNFVAHVRAPMVTVRETRAHMLMDFIVSALHDGKGVALKIKYPGREVGHFLTVFGYIYYADEDDFTLLFTDADDHHQQLRNFRVVWNDAAGRWDIQGLYGGWYLEYAISLNPA